MKGLRLLVTAFAAALIVAAPASAASVRAAYFASWDIYGRGYVPQQIPADKLNVIFYAFAQPALQPDGSVTCAPGDPWADYETPFLTTDVPDRSKPHVEGNFAELAKLKATHPGLKLVMSIGGWTFSKYFSDAAATPASRQAFVASCVDQFIKGNLPEGGWNELGGPGSAAGLFDGIDIDWEYPGIDPGNGADHSAADRHNATLLLQEFRRQLDATGHHYLLTAGLAGGNVHSTGSFELAQVARTVDWINVFGYDYHGGWDTVTDFNTLLTPDPFEPAIGGGAIKAFWNVAGTIAYYELNGVPADKLVLGVPFYGKEYVNVGPANHGLYQPFSNPATLNTDQTYHNLVDTGLVDPNLTPVGPTAASGSGAGVNGFTTYWDPFAQAPWLYNPTLNGGTFISYPTPRVIAERAALARLAGLRGVYAWEISQDDDAHDLVNAMAGR